jgi:D-alanyl-D-alanine carboxypeptidase (penicillin-binding protein 5/6)
MQSLPKKKVGFLTYAFYIVILIILAGILFIQHTLTPFEANATQSLQDLISPIGNLTRMSIADNLWLPNQTLSQQDEVANLTAQAAFFVDTKTGQVLFQKNSHQKLPIASLTKIMTMIVTLEHKNFNEEFKVSQRAADTQPDKMFLISGETLSLEELLDGVFLVSANDAAETLAEDTTGDRTDFIAQMNQKAKQLGMNESLFINPTGLEEDDPAYPEDSGHTIDQYSSAYDVALMSRYAIIHWPHLVDISSQPHIQLPMTQNHQDYDLNSGINLLTTYPGVVGFKTGYTPDAGLTLVTLARKDGHEVLGFLLGATDRRDDAKTLLDYSFKKLGVK